MKSINNFLTESKVGFDMKWKDSYEFKWKPEAKWISINVAESHYDWITEEDLDSWVPDYGMDQAEVDAMLKTKPGEVYTPDGWNYYFRIKK